MDKAIAQAEKAASVSFTEAAASLSSNRGQSRVLHSLRSTRAVQPLTFLILVPVLCSIPPRGIQDSLPLPCGLVARIPGFLPGGPGSISGMGTILPSIVRCSSALGLLLSRFLVRQNLGVGGYGSLDKCAVEEAPPSPGYHSRLFVVLKALGAFRLVIDLSFLNKHIFTQVSDGNGEDGVGFHQVRRLDGVS